MRIVHADPHFLVLYKPAGVVTQPGAESADDTLLNGVASTHGEALAALGYDRDFGLLHRLDRPTSGLVLVALTPEGYDGLRAQFATRTLKKTYVALIRGQISPARGTERAAIAEVLRDGRKRARVVTGTARVRGAQPAVTHWRTVTHNGRYTLLECEPETGRLHQIRAHLAHRGHAILGDRDYGPRDEQDGAFRRLAGKAIFLHAGALRFMHPVDGRSLTVEVPLPEDLAEALPALGLTCPARWRP